MNKGYDVSIFDNKEEASKYFDSILDNRVIGIGGSLTIHQMDLYPLINKHNKVYWHDYIIDNLSAFDIRKLASKAEVYISSVNAISMQGDIINIDHIGNRVGALSFGPSDVYLVIGKIK